MGTSQAFSKGHHQPFSIGRVNQQGKGKGLSCVFIHDLAFIQSPPGISEQLDGYGFVGTVTATAITVRQ